MKLSVGSSIAITLLFGGCSTISSANDGTGAGNISHYKAKITKFHI